MNSLVLDIGTTNIKAIIFDESSKIISSARKEISKKTENGRFEQDPKEILSASKEVLKEAFKNSRLNVEDIKGMGMTVQRETVIVWNKDTGEPVYPAILWEDNRGSEKCENLRGEYEKIVREKTGLLMSPYFSASKLSWILENINTDENLLWGTVDTWVMWNLLSEQPYATDYTNASRTMLFNIRDLSWDKELFDVWKIKIKNTPEAKPSLSKFGTLDSSILGGPVPLVAVSGDQQASMYGALRQGIDTKITFGTGTFLMQHLQRGFEVKDNFFTTLLPTKTGAMYSLEAKVGEFGQNVARLLEQKISLESITKEIALSLKPWIAVLPVFPNSIVVDGGITQSPFLLSALREIFSGTSFIEHPTFEGTALGVSYMVIDSEK